MKKIFLFFLAFVLFSCFKKNIEIERLEYGQQDVVTDASGLQYPGLDPTVISYCGPGWGRKMCRFLSKYDGTIWANVENNNSNFSDIKFSKFSNNVYFISFFDLDSNGSFCKGWKLGETNFDGKKWNIEIKKDQEDVLWFDYDYYGSNEEVEYSVTYKYEVIDGSLHFSSSEGETVVFSPSERNYSEDFLDTGEIISLEGCMFY